MAAAAQNAVLEGDDATTDAITVTTRLSNSTQIADKVARVSGTQQVVEKAGKRDELAYQIFKSTLELRRDCENDLLANNAEVGGNSSTARQLGGIEAWLNSNVAGGNSHSAGSLGNTARTDGANTSITEAKVKARLKSCFDAGGDPDCIMVGSFLKQEISGFTGNATRVKTAEDRSLVATVDVYASDFGDLEIIPNRFQVAESCLILEKRMWGVAYLRPVGITDLAKTGDSERRQVIVEYTLESRNEAASGAQFDNSTS